MPIRVQEVASPRLDEIVRYIRDRWCEVQAVTYITGQFAAVDQIDTGGVMSRSVPAGFGVEWHFFGYARHSMYWRRFPDGDIGIGTILHDLMDQMDSSRSFVVTRWLGSLAVHLGIPFNRLKRCGPDTRFLTSHRISRSSSTRNCR
ncbi:type II toxin-antitoxin system RelE/ParE family toxin [Tropicimonas aquimaris]|uniref:Type II toxin-antitoxin system RelE/ParE family toxin n=1 Tax=Tropicimonas aquimaris TaxID=914152 RepID=A0ABW3ITV8_9RHOB